MTGLKWDCTLQLARRFPDALVAARRPQVYPSPSALEDNGIACFRASAHGPRRRRGGHRAGERHNKSVASNSSSPSRSSAFEEEDSAPLSTMDVIMVPTSPSVGQYEPESDIAIVVEPAAEPPQLHLRSYVVHLLALQNR